MNIFPNILTDEEYNNLQLIDKFIPDCTSTIDYNLSEIALYNTSQGYFLSTVFMKFAQALNGYVFSGFIGNYISYDELKSFGLKLKNDGVKNWDIVQQWIDNLKLVNKRYINYDWKVE